MNDQWLTILGCGIPPLIVIVLAAVLGTRARLKAAAKIWANYKQGLYKSPQVHERYWALILVQMLALVVFVAAEAFAVLARSLVAAVVSGMALTISFICGYLAGRMMSRW